MTEQVLFRLVVGFCLWFAVITPTVAQDQGPAKKLLPVDEAAHDPTWTNFKNALLTALEKRDKKFVLSIVDPHIRNSFGSEPGLAEFKVQWDIDAEDSALWRKLSAALFLGGAYVKRPKGPVEFCAPYVTPKWPDGVDPHDHGVIVARDALVKAAPSSYAATIGTLSYDIVTVADWEVGDQSPEVRQRWVRVKLGTGEGYVPEEQIRSPIEHTACFIKTDNGWRMTALAVGGG